MATTLDFNDIAKTHEDDKEKEINGLIARALDVLQEVGTVDYPHGIVVGALTQMVSTLEATLGNMLSSTGIDNLVAGKSILAIGSGSGSTSGGSTGTNPDDDALLTKVKGLAAGIGQDPDKFLNTAGNIMNAVANQPAEDHNSLILGLFQMANGQISVDNTGTPLSVQEAKNLDTKVNNLTTERDQLKTDLAAAKSDLTKVNDELKTLKVAPTGDAKYVELRDSLRKMGTVTKFAGVDASKLKTDEVKKDVDKVLGKK